MEERVNVKQALNVFNHIHEHGEKKDNATIMYGIRAEVGFDGYTVSLSNDKVRLDIFFHNKFSLTYSKKTDAEDFLHTLATIQPQSKPQ